MTASSSSPSAQPRTVDTPSSVAADAVPVLTLAAALTLVECLLGAALVWGASLGAVLAGHVLIVGAASVGVYRRGRGRSRYGALACVSTAALGPFGAAGIALAWASERWHARRALSPDAWHLTLFPPLPETRRPLRQTPDDLSAWAPDADVTSFHDILAYGSVEERQAAIAIIAQQFDPSFAMALRAAPADEHNVIRVQAATAIARIERQLFERTRALETALERSPEDPDAILALATHNDDQAFAGLFEPAREQACRTSAADLYARYLRQRPDDARTEFRCARLLLRSGRPAEASARFQHLADAGHPTARLWLIESLYALGRYADARRETQAWTDRSSLDELPEARAALAVWDRPSEAA